MNRIKKSELINKLSKALLTITVLPDMTALRNEKNNLGICGFAVVKEMDKSKIIEWKQEKDDEYFMSERETSEYNEKFMHHAFVGSEMKFKEFVEKWK
jgi:hypothetical protein